MKKNPFFVTLVRKGGVFFFELLTSMFLLSFCIAAIWSGILLAFKNYERASNLYQSVVLACQFIEVDKNYTELRQGQEGCTIKQETETVCLELPRTTFKVCSVVVFCSETKSSDKAEIWVYDESKC